ncbi:YD repeat protein [Ostertagia ostertagi]
MSEGFAGTCAFADLEAWADGLDAASPHVERTEYGYDVHGQLKSTTSFGKAELGSGSVTFTQPSHQYVTYDAFGRLISTSNDAGVQTTYAYDGLNRLLSVKDVNQATTTYTYADSGRKTSITLDNGQMTVQLYGLDGRLITSTSYDPAGAGLGATRYIYDADGRLRTTQDPTGRRSWNFYDDAGRLQAEVDAAGQLIEYLRDAAGRVVQEIRYATRLSAATLAGLLDANGGLSSQGLSDIRPTADTARDRIQTTYYDAAGRVQATQDAEGSVVEFSYNGTNDVVRRTAYATALAVSRWNGGTTGIVTTLAAYVPPASDGARDRISRNVYSVPGRLSLSIDGEGYATTWSYDKAGRKTEQRRYATAIPAGNRDSAAPTLAASGDDELVSWIYDRQGRLIAEIDAEGHLTEYGYDSSGRLTDTLRYPTSLGRRVVWQGASQTFLTDSYDLARLNLLNRATLGAPQITRRTYEARGLLETETAADGTVTKYVYDRLQRLTTTIRAYDQDARADRVEFDGYGRVWKRYDNEDRVVATYLYDDAGRLISTKDARDHTTVYYYDDAGRLTFTIRPTDAGGEVTETVYSPFSETSASITHSNRLSASFAASLTGGRVADAAGLQASVQALYNADDRTGRTDLIFNRRGQVQQAIDALGHKTSYLYNAFGQLETTTAEVDASLSSARRLITSLGYDRRGYQVSNTAANASGVQGMQTRAEYDAFGRLSASIDARNQRTSYGYIRDAGQGRKVSITDPAGTTTTVYDAFERVVQRIDRLNNSVTFEYDTANRALTTTTAEGVRTITKYNRHGQVRSVSVDGAGGATTYAYDSRGNLKTVTDALGSVTANDYDLNNNLVQVVRGLKANAGASPTDDGSALTTTYTYDAANRMLTQTVNPGPQQQVTTYRYDGQGRQVRVVDPRGTVTRQTFNAKGELQEIVIDPVDAADTPDMAAQRLKLKTSYTYDAQSRLLTVIEGDGTSAAVKTEYQYDELGRRLLQTVDPDGVRLRTRFEYDTAGHVLVVRNALDELVWRYRYDDAGRLVDSIDGTGAATRHLYDAEGRRTATLAAPVRLAVDLSTVSDESLRTAIGTLLTGSESVNAQLFDKDGRPTFAINAMGEVSQRRYDKAGRVIEMVRYATRLAGPTASTVSTLAGQALALASSTQAADQHSYARHDALGRIRASIDATGAVTLFDYDRNGHLTQQTRFANRITGPLADDSDPVVTPNPEKDRIDYFLYDRAGREQYHVDAERYVTETVHDDATGTTTTRRYAARLTGDGPPKASDVAALDRTGAVTYGRRLDRAGRLSVESDGMGVQTVTAYDEAGRIQSITRAKDVQGVETTTSYTYNGAGQRSSMTVASNSAALAATTRYEYDARGNLQRLIDPRAVPLSTGDGAWEQAERKRLGYAPLLKDLSDGAKLTLTYVYSTTYQYDLMGRTTETRRMLDTGNPVVSTTAYDAFGNAITFTDPRGSKSYQVFDKANRLIQAIDAEGYLTAYGLDAFGNVETVRRVDAKVATVTAGSPVAYTPNEALDSLSSNTFDKANRLLTHKVWANADAETYVEGASGPLNAFGERDAALNKLGGVTRYSYDRLGRVTQETLPVTSTNAEGAVAKDAKGNPRLVTNAYTYDSRGNRLTSVEAVGLPEQRVTDMAYDAADRLVYRIGTEYTAVNADGSSLAYRPVDYTRYDALGRVIEVVRRGHWTDSGRLTAGTGSRSLTYYNLRGEVVSRIAADGACTIYTRDAVGNAIVETALAQPVDVRTAAAGGNPPAVTPTALKDRTALRVYDALGRLIEVQRVGLRYWESSGSDDSNFTTALSAPDKVKVRSLVYDAGGNVIQDIDARGNSVFRYYDKLGRQVLSVDQEGFATAWAYGRHHSAATTQTRYASALTTAQYGRQNDAGQPYSALGDPDRIRQTLSLADARISEYDFDRLGRISSAGTDLRAVALDAAAVDATLIHTFSAYNKRNLLTKTADIKVSYLKDQTTLSAAFIKQLTDLYGAITVAPPDPLKNLPTQITGTGGSFYATPVRGGSASALFPAGYGSPSMERTWVEGPVHTGAAEVTVASSSAAGTTLRFSTGLLPGGLGKVYVRSPGVGDWSAPIDIVNGLSKSPLPGTNGTWALIIAAPDGSFYRTTYTVSNGVATMDRVMTGTMTMLAPSVTIPLAHSTTLSTRS